MHTRNKQYAKPNTRNTMHIAQHKPHATLHDTQYTTQKNTLHITQYRNNNTQKHNYKKYTINNTK